MPSLATTPLRASITPLSASITSLRTSLTSFLAPASPAPADNPPPCPRQPVATAQRAFEPSSGARHSLLDLFLQILDGLLTPECQPPQAAPSSGMRGRHTIESLDVPAYLRRGVRIPELD